MKLVTKAALGALALAAIVATSTIELNSASRLTAAAMWGTEREDTSEQRKEKQTSQAVQSYILQGETVEHLSEVVAALGGEFDREFPIINAISALLTESQAREIETLDNIRLQDDRMVMTMSQGNQTFAINNSITQQTNADRLHEMGIRGDGVTIAVIDSGSNMGGIEGSFIFRDSYGMQKVAVKYDAIRGRKSYFYNDDSNGHGTHIANIVGSSLKSADGKFNGLAPDAYLLTVRAFNGQGISSYSKVLDALNWIFKNRLRYKIRVVNMSLGSQVHSRYWNDPINQAVSRLWDAGIVVVASAGNNGQSTGITVPGNNPYIITVGASADNNTPLDFSDDRIASFSAKGPTLDGFVKPDILAPGVKIAVKMDTRYTMQKPSPMASAQNYYQASGTSQSSAVVAGIAALIIQNEPTISPDDVKCRILSSGRASVTDGKYTFSPFEQGAGLVDAYAAVTSMASGCANVHLDIKADLSGTKHYIGPVVIDDKGEFAIETNDGSLLMNGAHWGDVQVDMNGAHWGSGEMEMLASHWGDGKLELLGTHWSIGEIDLQGTHWGGDTVDLLGTHWAGDTIDLLGTYWGERQLDLLSYDPNVEPIDPSVQMPIENDGWK